jgi:hypothetical protein
VKLFIYDHIFSNFAMRAWLESNPGGFKKDFDTWYKGLAAPERQVRYRYLVFYMR